MAWDEALDEMVLVTSAGNAPGGDQTWVWSGTRWVLKVHGGVAPSAFALPMAFDPITRSLIAEGCCYVPQSQLGALDTTWRWDGQRWDQLAGTAEPLPGSSLALDPDTQRLALCNCGPMLALPALASWTGRSVAATARSPRLPIEPVAEITDPTGGRLLIFGSAAPSNPYAAQPVHVWALAERGPVDVAGARCRGRQRACDGRVIDLLRDVRPNDFVVTDHQPPMDAEDAAYRARHGSTFGRRRSTPSDRHSGRLGNRGTAAARSATVSPANQRRLQRLSVELDVLEMVPFSDPDAAYAPAVALERRRARLGDEIGEKRAQLIQADVLCRKGKHTASGQVIREINEWATEHGHRHLMARSHRLLSVFFDFIGDVPSAWEHAVPAVDLLDDTMPERMRADHLFGLGQVLVRTGAWDAARERYRAALQLADGLDDVPLRVKILNNLAWLEDDAGDTHQSMEIAKRMQAFAERHNVTLDAACLDTVANAQLKLGLFAEAEATLRPILDDRISTPARSRALAKRSTPPRVHNACRDTWTMRSRPSIVHRAVRDARDARPSASRRSRSAPVLYADQGLFQRAYEQYIEFHAEDAALRAAQREANARTLQAVFETTEARREGERFRAAVAARCADRPAQPPSRRHRAAHPACPLARGRIPAVDRTGGSRPVQAVNDRFSHAVGDKVLVRVSGILAAATAESGWAARMGGEEFLLVFPALTIDEALRRCEDVRRAIESVRWDGAMAGETVTASIGFTLLQSGRTSQAALLGQADRNLYAAKHQGTQPVVSDLSRSLTADLHDDAAPRSRASRR